MTPPVDLEPEFRPLREDEMPALRTFLAEAFKQPASSAFLSDAQLRWKYFEPGPEWSGPRSYAITQGSKILAHGGLWPMVFLAGDRRIVAAMLLDWAADPKSPGVGQWMLDEVRDLVGVRIGIGGSSSARRLAKASALRQKKIGDLVYFRKIVRPFREAYPGRPAWKRLAKRLLDTAKLLRSPAGKPPAGWSLSPINRFDDAFEQRQRGRRPGFCTLLSRPSLFLNYLLACPNAEFRGFELVRDGKSVGYLILSFLGRSARIADIWVDSDTVGDWTAAVQCALAQVRSSSPAAHITAAAAIPPLGSALAACGFVRENVSELTAADPHRQLDGLDLICFSMLESDSAFLA